MIIQHGDVLLYALLTQFRLLTKPQKYVWQCVLMICLEIKTEDYAVLVVQLLQFIIIEIIKIKDVLEVIILICRLYISLFC